MNRRNKLIFNTIAALLYQFILLVNGFLIPKMLLEVYGSAVNGLISSITQFLNVISLCDMGVAAVVQSSLYMPLAEDDRDGISRIVLSSECFFQKIAYIFLLYIGTLLLFFPKLIAEDFGYFYTASLILVIAAGTFAQYYFGMTYQLLFTADQLGFVCLLIKSGVLILTTVVSIVMLRLEYTIHSVKMASTLLFLLQPLSLAAMAKRRYRINRSVVISDEPIKQKWNGFAQHISSFVLANTDVVVLSVFTTLEDVSIYSVYYLVVGGVKTIVSTLSNGMQSLLGNMLANKEHHALRQTFARFEWLQHTVVTVVFSLTGVLIVPFVKIYTKGIMDVDYNKPLFGALLTLAYGIYCLRLPYNTLVLAAGHYKQTQRSAFLEAVINVVVSVVTVTQFGLIGVALGTIIAMLYRTLYLAWYTQRILHRNSLQFLQHLLLDIISIGLFIGLFTHFMDYFSIETLTYVSWAHLALKSGAVCLLSVLSTYCVFYFSHFIMKKKSKRIS